MKDRILALLAQLKKDRKETVAEMNARLAKVGTVEQFEVGSAASDAYRGLRWAAECLENSAAEFDRVEALLGDAETELVIQLKAATLAEMTSAETPEEKRYVKLADMNAAIQAERAAAIEEVRAEMKLAAGRSKTVNAELGAGAADLLADGALLGSDEEFTARLAVLKTRKAELEAITISPDHEGASDLYAELMGIGVEGNDVFKARLESLKALGFGDKLKMAKRKTAAAAAAAGDPPAAPRPVSLASRPTEDAEEVDAEFDFV